MDKEKEWRLIEICSIALYNEEVLEEFKSLCYNPEIDWLEVMDQAIRQGMLPLLTYILCSHKLLKRITVDLQDIFINEYLINKKRLDIGYSELAKVTSKLKENNISYVITKGFSLDCTIYGTRYIRKTNDIDFIIEPRNKKHVSEIMQELGFVNGQYLYDTDSIKPISAEYQKLYALVDEYAPEFVKRTSDDIVRCIYMDMTCSLTWFASKYKVDIGEALLHNQWVVIPGSNGIKMSIFNLEYQIIYTGLHLFKHAWVEMYGIMDDKDVQLSRFMDILWLLKEYEKKQEIHELRDAIEKCGVVEPIIWVIKHTDIIFGTTFCDRLGYSKIESSWLSSWQTIDYKIKYWKGSMIERLQAKDKNKIFS